MSARLLVLACLQLIVAAPSAAAVPRFGPVFVIVGENTSYEQVTPARAPYFMRTVRPRAAWLSDYHSFTRSKSLGNYIAMVSGQYTGCEAANALPADCRQNAPNLFAQLAATGRTWRVWLQSMPGPCTRSDSDQYVAHHNPALYFTGLRGSCRSRDLPMGNGDTAAFNAALGAGRAGDFNLVVPNNCDNGHDPCGGDPVRHFDDFLAREVPRIQSSPSFGPRGVIVVVWDEGADAPHDPGHVAAAVLGPLVRPGVVDRTRHNHYSLERMLADGFRVAPLARARQASPISGIWR